MKFMKLFSSTVAAFMLVSAPQAMAANGDCKFGVLLDEAVGDLTVEGDCIVQDVIINGDLTVNNTPGETFVLRDSTVTGNFIVKGGTVIIEKSLVTTSNLVVKNTVDAVIHGNMVSVGNMRVVQNGQVLISRAC
jgi:hypothetical protein